MSKKTKNILILLVVVFLFIFTFDLALVQAAEGGADTNISGSGTGLQNPLGNEPGDADPRVIIGKIIRAALGIVGSLALAVFIYGGFTWVISAGNDDKIKKGKDMIVWATIGLAVIFTSYALVTFVIGAVAGTGGST